MKENNDGNSQVCQLGTLPSLVALTNYRGRWLRYSGLCSNHTRDSVARW